ncbi:MAG: ABC transporter ATP-binding protein [Pseudomonadota bacterium]
MYALTIENLYKTYNNNVHALNGISLKIEEGDFFALLGPNGAGKSTLINIICSLVVKTSGLVRIFDTDIDVNFSKAKSYIGIVSQEFNFSPFEKVIDIIINQAGYYGIRKKTTLQRAEKYLKMLDLWNKRDSVAGYLSGGMKRRLMIVRALIHQPKLLILDEPTAGVDIELRRGLWQFLRDINQDGITVILTTHYLEEAENLCRNIAIIDQGKIIEHTSMRDMLKKLDKQTFILESENKLPDNLSLEAYAVRRMDNYSLEIDLHRHDHINKVFDLLSQQNIIITDIRNKSNRLEELFVHLTTKN